MPISLLSFPAAQLTILLSSPLYIFPSSLLQLPSLPSHYHPFRCSSLSLLSIPIPATATLFCSLSPVPMVILGSRGSSLSKAPSRSHAVAATEKTKTHTAMRKLCTGLASNDALTKPAKASNFVWAHLMTGDCAIVTMEMLLDVGDGGI